MLFTRQQIKPRKPKPKYVQPPSVNVSLRQELPTDKYNVQYKPADIKTVRVVLEKVKQHRESWIDSVLLMSMQKSSQVYCDFLENAEEQQYATMDYEKTMAGIFAFDIGHIKPIHLSVESNGSSCSSTTPVYDFSQKMEKIKLVTQDFASKTLQQEIDHTMIQFVKKSINSSWLDALESNDSSLDNIDHTFDMKRLQKHYKRMMVWAEQMPKPKQTESLLTLLQSSFRRSMHMVTDSLLSYVTDSPKEGHVYSFSQRLKHMRQFVETSDTEPSMKHEDEFDIRRVFSQRFDEFKMQLPEDEVGQYEEIYEDMIENAFGWKLDARLDLALTEEGRETKAKRKPKPETSEMDRPFTEKLYKFCFITASYNNEKNVMTYIESIAMQNYKHWRIIYVNDCSTDSTDQVFHKACDSFGIRDKVTYIKNEVQQYQSYSKHIAYQHTEDDEICIILDGDDWLSKRSVLDVLAHTYYEQRCMMTYSDMIVSDNGVTHIQCSSPVPNNVRYLHGYRTDQWRFYHLRTGFAKLFKMIPIDYLKMDNIWLDRCTDLAELFCVAEMAGDRVQYIPDTLCVYNKTNSLNYKNSYYVDKMSNRRKEITKFITNKPKLRCIYEKRFPTVYIINLEEDTQSLQNMKDQCKFAKITDPIVMQACNGYKDIEILDRYHKYIVDYENNNIVQSQMNVRKKHINNAGAMGLIYSTYKLYNEANHLDHICVLEDDVYFHKNILTYMFALDEFEDKDFVLIGYNHPSLSVNQKVNTSIQKMTKLPKTNELGCFYGAYGYICSKRFRDHVLKLGIEHIIDNNCSIDLFFNVLRMNDTSDLSFYVSTIPFVIPEVRKNGIQTFRNDEFYRNRNINLDDYHIPSQQPLHKST